jgi:Ca2+-binding EF-hand superfamily protein
MKAHAQQRFNVDDKNHDGCLTEAEVPQRWAHLKVADANHDNKITFDELRAAFKSGVLGHSRHQESDRSN